MNLSARFPFLIQRRVLFLDAVLFIGALLLRLYRISEQNLWFDEHWTLRVAAAPLAELPNLLSSYESSKPPLYFALIHYWLNWGSGEFWLRLPSAIFGALSCVVGAAIGRRFFGAQVALGLGCLVALSPFHIYYSQEARPYALFGLLMGLAFLFHLRFCETPRSRFLIGYMLCAVLACYTFPYAFVIVGFSVLFAFAYRPALSRQKWRQLLAGNGLIMLLYTPWLRQMMASVSNGVGFLSTHRGPVSHAAAYSYFSMGLGTSFGPSMESLRVMGVRIFREIPIDGALLVLGCLLLAALACVGLTHLWRTNRNAFYFALCGILVFWGSPAVFNLLNPDIPYNARYAFPALFFILIITLGAWLAAMEEGGWKWSLIGLFVLGAGSSLFNLFFVPKYARDDLRSAAHFVRDLRPPPERIFLCAGYLSEVFSYYYEGKAPLRGMMVGATTSSEELLEPVRQSEPQVRRFAMIYSRPDHGDPRGILPGVLETHYRLVDKRHWTGVDVYVFERAQPVCQHDGFRDSCMRRRRGFLHWPGRERYFPQIVPRSISRERL